MNTRIIAHRGASADAPENTLAAFELARRQGAQMIELDVRPTADGAIVVFHDHTTERWNGRPDAVTALTLAQMQQIDLRGERAPTLDEVCAWARETAMPLNVEIKVAGIETAVAESIRRHGIDDLVIISSFLFEALRTMRAVAPQLRRGVLMEPDTTPPPSDEQWTLGILSEMEAHAWHPSWRHPQLEALIPPTRRAGYAINVWTVDDPAVMRQLLALEVEGIITNRPALLAEVIHGWQDKASTP